jgi:hypothetical protein
MTKLGRDLIKAADEALAFARGELDPKTYRVRALDRAAASPRRHARGHKARPSKRLDRAGKVRGGATFACPACGGRSFVLRTRRQANRSAVLRRRQCLSCQTIFDTREIGISRR